MGWLGWTEKLKICQHGDIIYSFSQTILLLSRNVKNHVSVVKISSQNWYWGDYCKMTVTAILLCCSLNIPLCMKLKETKQKVFLVTSLYFICGFNDHKRYRRCCGRWVTSRTLPVPRSCFMAMCRSQSVTWGNSSTPLWMRKHLKPATPAWIMGRSSSYKETAFVCVCFGRNSAQSGWECVQDVPHCQESHLPRRPCPQNTSLPPPAASHENYQV